MSSEYIKKIRTEDGDKQIDYESLANLPEIPSKISDLENDSAFIITIPKEYITESELNAKGYLTQHQSLDEYAKKVDHYTKTESDNKYQPKGNYLTQHQDISGKADKATTLAGYGISDGVTKEEFDAFGGSVEITDGNPTKANTVLTIDTITQESVSVYTSEEVDFIAEQLQEVIIDEATIQNMIDTKFNSIVNGNEVAY